MGHELPRRSISLIFCELSEANWASSCTTPVGQSVRTTSTLRSFPRPITRSAELLLRYPDPLISHFCQSVPAKTSSFVPTALLLSANPLSETRRKWFRLPPSLRNRTAGPCD